MANNLVERLSSEKKVHHQNLRSQAKRDAEEFVSAASYGFLRTIHRRRTEILECTDGVFVAPLLEDGELGDHFRGIRENDPETFECDDAGRLDEDGIVFLAAWFEEACKTWDEVSSQLR